MSRITNSLKNIIERFADLLSKPFRDNFTNYQNAINDNQTQIDNLLTPPAGSEVTNARDSHANLRDRVRANGAGFSNIVLDGMQVTETTVPALTVDVTAGEALVHASLDASVGVDIAAATSGAISVPTTQRKDVVVANSDNTFSVVTGNDSADDVLPSIALTQRPLARIDITSATVTILDAIITDISEQGCQISGTNQWFFDIQSAVDALNDRSNSVTSGEIIIHKGEYFEEVDLSGLGSVTLKYENGAIHYRPSATGRCIKSVNSGGTETVGIKIIGGDFRGNSKAGSLSLIEMEYTDEFSIEGGVFDGNASSSATSKDLDIDNCDTFRIVSKKATSFTLGATTTDYHIDLQDRLSTTKDNGKTTIELTDTTANVGITIGGDTNLYRNSANEWKSDDAMVVTTIEALTGIRTSTLGLNTFFKTTIMTIGDWNMDANSTNDVTYPSPVVRADIFQVGALCRRDDDTIRIGLEGSGRIELQSTFFRLVRTVGGPFDSTNYDATSFNRGWIYIIHT